MPAPAELMYAEPNGAFVTSEAVPRDSQLLMTREYMACSSTVSIAMPSHALVFGVMPAVTMPCRPKLSSGSSAMQRFRRISYSTAVAGYCSWYEPAPMAE